MKLNARYVFEDVVSVPVHGFHERTQKYEVYLGDKYLIKPSVQEHGTTIFAEPHESLPDN